MGHSFNFFGTSVVIGALAIIVTLIVAVAGIINYIFRSIALYTLAKRKGLSNAGLAWIPIIAPEYVLGEIVGPFKLFGIRLTSPGLVLLIASVINIFGVSFLPNKFIKLIVDILILLLILCFKYNLFKIYSPNNVVLYTVLSVIPVVKSILLFIIKDYAPCGKADDLFDSNKQNAVNMNNNSNQSQQNSVNQGNQNNSNNQN